MRPLRPGRSLGLRLGRFRRGTRAALQEAIESRRRQRALAAPVGEAFQVDEEAPAVRDRIERAQVLQKAPATRTSVVGDHDAVEGPFLGSCAGKPNGYSRRAAKARSRGPPRQG